MAVGINYSTGRLEHSTVVNWVERNSERTLKDAIFNTKECLSCQFNTGNASLFGGKTELGSCVDFEHYNKLKREHLNTIENALLAKHNKGKLPLVGSASKDWNGKVTFKGRPVHTKPEGELLKLIKESEGKKEKEAAVGLVTIKEEGVAKSIGYVILKTDRVKSKKLLPPIEKPGQDWERASAIREAVLEHALELYNKTKFTEKQLAVALAQNENIRIDKDTTLAEVVQAYLGDKMNAEDLASNAGIKDYDKWYAPLAKAAGEKYDADKKAKESVPVPASAPQAGSGNEEGEDGEEDGE